MFVCVCVSGPLRWSRPPRPAGPLAAVRRGCPSGDDPQVPGNPRGYCWGTPPRSSHPSLPTDPAFRLPPLQLQPPQPRCCSTGRRCSARAPGWQTGPMSCLCCPDSAIRSWRARLLRFLLLQLWNLLLLLLPRCCLLLHLSRSSLRYRSSPLLRLPWVRRPQSRRWFPRSLLLQAGNVQCSEPHPPRSQTPPRWWCYSEHTCYKPKQLLMHVWAIIIRTFSLL